jgi:hypothetical protein
MSRLPPGKRAERDPLTVRRPAGSHSSRFHLADLSKVCAVCVADPDLQGTGTPGAKRYLRSIGRELRREIQRCGRCERFASHRRPDTGVPHVGIFNSRLIDQFQSSVTECANGRRKTCDAFLPRQMQQMVWGSEAQSPQSHVPILTI